MSGAAEVRAAARADGLRRLRPGLPQRRAAGRDRRRPAARVSTTTPRSSPGTGGWCPTTSTSSCPQPTSTGSRRTTPRWPQELTEQLREHADEQGYVFTGPVTIAFESADDLTTGRFRVRSRAGQVTPVSNRHRHRVRRARVFLEVNGTRHPLDPPGLVVGRGTEADLRINDPGVSRRHVEFRVTPATARRHRRQRRATSAPPTACSSTAPRQQATARRRRQVKIGNTTMTVGPADECDVDGRRGDADV